MSSGDGDCMSESVNEIYLLPMLEDSVIFWFYFKSLSNLLRADFDPSSQGSSLQTC